MTIELSIVIPIFNESALISELIKRLLVTRQLIEKEFENPLSSIEIIFVNDGSSDQSFDLLKEICGNQEGFKLLNLSRNFGHQYAITAGLQYSTGSAIVLMDGDLQDPPEFIADLYRKMKEGYDVVYAVREKRKGENPFKLVTASLYYKLLQKLIAIPIPADTGDFRLMTRRVADLLLALPESHRFIRGLVTWIGFKQTGLFYVRDRRYAGKTKFSITKMVRFALDGMTSFSTVPLKLASYVGFMMTILGVFYAGYTLYVKYFTTHTVQGWSSLMLVVLISAGAQLITLGIIGEYIGRIYDETKKRPLYVVEGLYQKQNK
ncbi:MAG: glycosyltransferase family 2 protein [Candidatus Margulisiibacteriota bacterium]